MNNNETIKQKKRRLAGKIHYLQPYVKDLNKLLFCEVTPDMLTSVVETDLFFEAFPHSSFELKRKETFSFDDKEKMLTLLHKEVLSWNSPYYIYIMNVEYCGMLEIPSLDSFNWNTKFIDDIISLVRKNGKEKIVIDFYEEFSEYLIDVGIYRLIEKQ